MAVKTKKETAAPEFSKQQLLASKRYCHRKDILNVLLKADMVYSIEQVDKILITFMKGKVN